MSQGYDPTKPATNDTLESEPIRLALKAIASLNYGAAAPSDPEPGWLWADTNNFPATVPIKMYVNGSWLTILSNIMAGPPTQSAVGKYEHSQSAASMIWTINHSLNNEYVWVTCYDVLGYVMYPDTIQSLSPNQTVLTFLVNVAGTAEAIG